METSFGFLMDRLNEIRSLACSMHLISTNPMIDCYQEMEPGYAVLQCLLSQIEMIEEQLKEARKLAIERDENLKEEMKKFEQGFAYKPKKKDG